MKLRLLITFFTMMMLAGVNAQVTSVGLIGSATPGGWDADTNMTQHPDSSHLWSLTITLIDGLAKFRADDAWTINWGSPSFPIGVGYQDGPDIPVIAGTYDITFNSNTGAYHFSSPSDIGIIGSATPYGWDVDVNMLQDATDTNSYSITMNLVAGAAKFRANDAWDINWGSADFPGGIGVQNGPDIPIPLAGEYAITFNKSTGEYYFQLLSFGTIGLIGDATPGGTTPTPMAQSGTNQWSATVVLTDGGVQFSADGGSTIWGGTDFPVGTATIDGPEIPVTGGRYIVEFNTASLEYSFTPVTYYQTVGIIGSATPLGWDVDTDMMLSTSGDSSEWQLRVELIDGELKFRANDAWDINWGGADFPTGVATLDGPNIPVTAGEYNIYFNSFTGEYNFVEILVYDRIGLVGSGTPTMSWDVDFFLTQDDADENVWYLPSITLNGEVKFRADSMWAVNWGATDFPEGVGTQDGPNIPVPSGTYGITFNSASGEYVFGEPIVSTKDILNPDRILAYPNPASDQLNIDISGLDLNGTLTLNVFDINGKLLLSDNQQADDILRLNVSNLQNGYYTLHISNDKYVIGKKFAVVK